MNKLFKLIIERIYKPKSVIDYWFNCKTFQLNVHLEPDQFRKDCENIYELIRIGPLEKAEAALTEAYNRWGYYNSEFARIETMIHIKANIKETCVFRE